MWCATHMWLCGISTRVAWCGRSRSCDSLLTWTLALQLALQIYKYTNTQIHKYTNTQIIKCSNVQLHKYINTKYQNTQIIKFTNNQIPKYLNTQIHKARSRESSFSFATGLPYWCVDHTHAIWDNLLLSTKTYVGFCTINVTVSTRSKHVKLRSTCVWYNYW